MALNYGDNYVLKIKKGLVEYAIQDAVAKAAIEVIQGDASTEGSIAKAEADAKAYADGLASNYDAAGTATTAIATLDATVGSQTVATGKHVAVEVVETDGVLTGLTVTEDDIASAQDLADLAATVEEHSEVTAAALVDLDSRLDTAETNAANAASSAETAAKTYAKGLVDAILGEDSASTTLATLKAVIAELNDPANANGITGTFVDTVKADLAGLTKTVNNEQVHATVKEYVDNAVAAASGNASGAIAALDAEVTSSDGTNVQVKVTEVDGKITAVNVTTDNTVNATDVSTAISTAIQAIDATPSQSAGADGLALSLTQADGVVTGISGSIAANTYDSYGAASTVQSTVIGASGDAASANTIYGAKAYADSLASNYDAAGAASTAKSEVIGESTDADSANTIYGAKAYADTAIANQTASYVDSNHVLILGL